MTTLHLTMAIPNQALKVFRFGWIAIPDMMFVESQQLIV
jgi:hypothetical protein